jgi:hypothetical protein
VRWAVKLYQTEKGVKPVAEFIKSLPEKHRAKVVWEIDMLEREGVELKEPHVILICIRNEGILRSFCPLVTSPSVSVAAGYASFPLLTRCQKSSQAIPHF